jgi:hypothetical protein
MTTEIRTDYETQSVEREITICDSCGHEIGPDETASLLAVNPRVELAPEIADPRYTNAPIDDDWYASDAGVEDTKVLENGSGRAIIHTPSVAELQSPHNFAIFREHSDWFDEYDDYHHYLYNVLQEELGEIEPTEPIEADRLFDACPSCASLLGEVETDALLPVENRSDYRERTDETVDGLSNEDNPRKWVWESNSLRQSPLIPRPLLAVSLGAVLLNIALVWIATGELMATVNALAAAAAAFSIGIHDDVCARWLRDGIVRWRGEQ